MVLGLLGAYDSDDEADNSSVAVGGGGKSAPNVSPGVGKAAPTQCGGTSEAGSTPGRSRKTNPAVASEGSTRVLEKHGAACTCRDCEGLLARFAAKSLQTKGIRFKCKLCGDLTATKAESAAHFRRSHSSELQAFKRQKDSSLFTGGASKSAFAVKKKISFARDDILGKRKADDDVSFGGWAKKEKPEPPPCEQPGFDEMEEPVITAPPWLSQSRPDMSEATDTDKQVDQHVRKAQYHRFSKRNVLEVNATTVRCKLCYKTLADVPEAEKHVVDAHQPDFEKELEIWERFLFTSSKRQPPFGWVCKMCNLFFPNQSAVWTHIGREVFLRQEERHMGQWHEKEDRWGHEEDEECCGDGFNVTRLSYDSVKLFNVEAQQREAEEAVASMGAKGKMDEESSDGEAGDQVQGGGELKFIQEF